MTTGIVSSLKNNKTMDTTNQIFSWKRFSAALRKEVTENWLQLVLILLALYLLLTAVLITANVFKYDYRGYGYVFRNDPGMLKEFVLGMIMSGAWMILVAVTASLAFRKLTSKPGRIALLTEPTSTTEKYAVNLTVYVIGAFVALIACGYLADLTRYSILSLVKVKNVDVSPPANIINAWLTGENGSMFFKVSFSPGYKYLAFVSLLAAPAIYFMGSVLWPKWSIIKSYVADMAITNVIMAVVFAVLSVPMELAQKYGEYGLDMNGNLDLFESTYSDGIVLWSGIKVIVALIFWYASWYLFKRKDVVSLKWWK